MTDLPGWVDLVDPAEQASQHINTDGVVSVGEINTRLMREAITEPDHREAVRSGLSKAYRECAVYAQERIDGAGPYDDTRALKDMVTWLGDRIREVHANATNGSANA